MGIQSNINQALTLGSAGAYGIEHLKNQRAEQILKGTEMINRLDEKVEEQEVELEKLSKDPKYINSEKEIESIVNDIDTIGGLDAQARDLINQGIMDVNPLGMNEYIQKSQMAKKHLTDRLESQKMITEEYKSRIDGLKRKQARLVNENDAYQPFIEKAIRLGGLK